MSVIQNRFQTLPKMNYRYQMFQPQKGLKVIRLFYIIRPESLSNAYLKNVWEPLNMIPDGYISKYSIPLTKSRDENLTRLQNGRSSIKPLFPFYMNGTSCPQREAKANLSPVALFRKMLYKCYMQEFVTTAVLRTNSCHHPDKSNDMLQMCVGFFPVTKHVGHGVT